MITVFTVLIKTTEAEWEWIVDTQEAMQVWELLGTPSRMVNGAVAVAHGQMETGL